jgi:hypothetical protein
MKSPAALAAFFLALGATSLACSRGATTSAVAENQSSSEWKRVTVQSTSGLVIAMDYQVMHSYDGDSYSYSLWPLWFNVTQEAVPLQTMQQIRVVLTPWSRNTSKDGPNQAPGLGTFGPETVDLRYAEQGRFSGQVAAPFVITEGNESGGYSVTEKLSVVVEDQWQNDAIDGKRDFLPGLGL